MSPKPRVSVLWFLTGAMVLIVAAACGSALSGALTAGAATAGARESTIAAVAVGALLAGFAIALVTGVRDLRALARRGVASLPPRWVLGSLLAMLVAGPFWNLCVVHVQEPITGSDAVRTLFDNVLYTLVLTLVLPLGVGTPLALARERRIGALVA